MKKLLAILLALMMVLVSAAALAEGKTISVSSLDAPTKPQTITIKKNYTVDATNNWSLPKDALTFTQKTAVVEDGPAATAPAVSITVVPITGGETLSYDARITLPAYTQVGVYYYTFTESDNKVAGITYIKNDITLRVTVTQGATGLVVAGVALRENSENGIKTAESETTGEGTGEATTPKKTEYDLSKKIDSFENKYEAGSLTLSKKVEGNLGDLEKEWEFEVTFTCNGKKVNAPITYKERATDTETKSIAAEWTGSHEAVKVYLKSGDKVQFDNIPVGVSYSIKETDANKDGYETTPTNATGTFTAAKETKEASFLNVKNINIDTGVALDSAVYMMIMALALAGFVALKIRRREEN